MSLALGIAVLLILGLLAHLGDLTDDARTTQAANLELAEIARNAHDTARRACATTREGLAREDQLVVILRHMGLAIEHAVNGDHDLVTAVLSEVTTSGEAT